MSLSRSVHKTRLHIDGWWNWSEAHRNVTLHFPRSSALLFPHPGRMVTSQAIRTMNSENQLFFHLYNLKVSTLVQSPWVHQLKVTIYFLALFPKTVLGCPDRVCATIGAAVPRFRFPSWLAALLAISGQVQDWYCQWHGFSPWNEGSQADSATSCLGLALRISENQLCPPYIPDLCGSLWQDHWTPCHSWPVWSILNSQLPGRKRGFSGESRI